jgi:hypothetical protein
LSALALFASFLGRGFQDFNADDFVGELTTSSIFLSTSIIASSFCMKFTFNDVKIVESNLGIGGCPRSDQSLLGGIDRQLSFNRL